MPALPPTVIQLCRLIAAGVATLVIAWYLFADTLRHYAVLRAHSTTNCVLRFRHFGGYEDYVLWREVIDDFQRVHPDVLVRQEYSTATQSLYHAKLRQEMLVGAAPEVALVQWGPFAELASHFEIIARSLGDSTAALKGPVLISPLSQSLIDDLDPQALRAFQTNGIQRGLPVSGGPLMIYCNLDCFDRASRVHHRSVDLPSDRWDMDAFRSLAEDLTLDADGDGKIEQFGLFPPRWVYALPFVWSFGADIVDPHNGQWMFFGEPAEAAVSFYKGLITSRRVCPREEELPLLAQDVAFLTGRTAMCINGPWFEQFLDRTRLADRYRVLPVPRGPGGRWTRMTWDGVVLAPGLGHSRRAAVDAFVGFLISATVQDRIAAAGRAIPARRASLKAYLEGPRPKCRSPFVDSLAYARLESVAPAYIQLDVIVTREMQRFLDPHDGRTARQFLEELRRDSFIVEHLGEGLPP